MTTDIKYLLKEAITIYKNATEKEKEKYRASIEKNLNEHDKAMHHIGMGLSSEHIQAALIFKRIFKF